MNKTNSSLSKEVSRIWTVWIKKETKIELRKVIYEHHDFQSNLSGASVLAVQTPVSLNSVMEMWPSVSFPFQFQFKLPPDVTAEKGETCWWNKLWFTASAKVATRKKKQLHSYLWETPNFRNNTSQQIHARKKNPSARQSRRRHQAFFTVRKAWVGNLKAQAFPQCPTDCQVNFLSAASQSFKCTKILCHSFLSLKFRKHKELPSLSSVDSANLPLLHYIAFLPDSRHNVLEACVQTLLWRVFFFFSASRVSFPFFLCFCNITMLSLKYCHITCFALF